MYVIQGLIVLVTLFLIYIAVLFLLCWFAVPQEVGFETSIVTNSKLGIRGDLGNQIFQLLTLQSIPNCKVVLPTRVKNIPLYDLFDLQDLHYDDLPVDHVVREFDNYQELVIPGTGKIYDIYGYRQSYKYFDPAVVKQLKIKDELLQAMRKVLPEQYICVHVRGTDHIKLTHNIPFCQEFAECTSDYFLGGLKYLRRLFPEHEVLVCTDDRKFAAKFLITDCVWNFAPVPQGMSPKLADFCTLYLSSGNVISNSTFSWTASYLGNSVTVVPNPWWDPAGFIGGPMRLDSYHMFPEKFIPFDAATGKVSMKIERVDEAPLNIYRLIRGLIV
jgi:hypothetical protein